MITQFTWNAAKAASNLQKHGIAFEAAVQVFADPNKLVELDLHERSETRWRTVGRIEGNFVILVVHLDCEEGDREIIRLISARPASKLERKQYEQNRYSLLY
jgi:uncharacterized protein